MKKNYAPTFAVFLRWIRPPPQVDPVVYRGHGDSRLYDPNLIGRGREGEKHMAINKNFSLLSRDHKLCGLMEPISREHSGGTFQYASAVCTGMVAWLPSDSCVRWLVSSLSGADSIFSCGLNGSALNRGQINVGPAQSASVREGQLGWGESQSLACVLSPGGRERRGGSRASGIRSHTPRRTF